ncbi:MAG: hypothetical protein Q9220_007542 [cf. Caloplaca sp. 1 TL-2023]
MHYEHLPISALKTWASLNDVQFSYITTDETFNNEKGHGLVSTAEVTQENKVLLAVPPHLVLSLENVWIYSKSDRHLHEVLHAVGEYAHSARGAILIFLLMQITHNASTGPDKIGVLNPLAEYVKFLPPNVPLPTFWTDGERSLASRTTLEAALEAKLKSLDREFTHLRDSTALIDWCQKAWWNPGTGSLTFEDWKRVDAMYRSRALDLPGTGHAMVPCVDMANHASGDATTALYESDSDGNAVLVLREGKTLKPGDEVSITYGDDKGACEMLFSYGFIEDSMTSARELFLDLEIPDDDPLKLAKKAVSKSAPGFKLSDHGGSIDWEGDFVWLICVNEEDGLDFRLLQTLDGEQELQMLWNDYEIQDVTKFQGLLQKEQLWDVFRLRAVATLQARVEQQLLALEQGASRIKDSMRDSAPSLASRQTIMRLRELEEGLLLQAYERFESKVFLKQLHPSDLGCIADKTL